MPYNTAVRSNSIEPNQTEPGRTELNRAEPKSAIKALRRRATNLTEVSQQRQLFLWGTQAQLR